MSPLPVIFALRDAWVHIHFMDSDNMSSNIKASVDQHFTILAALSVPDINPDDSYIKLGRCQDR